MPKITLIIFLLFSCSILKSQGDTTKIEIEKTYRTVYKMNGVYLRPKKILALTKSNQYAYLLMQRAKRNGDAGSVAIVVGGAMVAYGLIQPAFFNKEIDTRFIAVGGGLLLLSLPLNAILVRQTKEAVQIYNDELNKTGEIKYDLKLSYNVKGFGLQLNF